MAGQGTPLVMNFGHEREVGAEFLFVIEHPLSSSFSFSLLAEFF